MVITPNDCLVCKYLCKDEQYDKCPECSAPFVRDDSALLAEFKQLLSEIKYDHATSNDDKSYVVQNYNKNIKHKKYSKFKIYILNAEGGNDKYYTYLSANPSDDYGIDPKIISSIFEPIQKDKSQHNDFCIYDILGCDRTLVAKCIHQQSGISPITCPGYYQRGNRSSILFGSNIIHADYFEYPLTIFNYIFRDALIKRNMQKMLEK